MNLPNKLTIFRIILTIIFIWVITLSGLPAKIWAAVLFALASITDFLDGYIARKHNLITSFGKIMDPVADKFLILSAFYIFVYLGLIYGWMFYVIAAREILITLWRLCAVFKGKVLAAEKLGKLKTIAQITCISIILIYIIIRETQMGGAWSGRVHGQWSVFIQCLMYGVVTITLASGISFLWNNRRQSHA